MTGAIRAAGGVVWRRVPGRNGDPEVEIALIHRPRYDDWSIPKGKLSAGENEIDGAIREVLEETGCRVRLGRFLGEVRYMKEGAAGEARPKVVRYWAMEAIGGAFVPGPEVDELRWLSLADAKRELTRNSDREILDRFVHGPAVTRTVLLLRHATAGSRSDWTGDDRLRPLDENGRRQAEELVRLLSRFDVHEIVSADYARCTETVSLLAGSIGLSIEEEPLFGEAGYPGNEERAVKLLRSLGHPGGATVVSSQGDVIPDLLARLAEEDHVDLSDVGAKKGSVWVLSFDDADRLFSAYYLPPPRIEPD